MKLITLNIDTIRALCDKYHVRTLFAFGSVTRDELKPSSDIDLVVDIDSNDPLSWLSGIKQAIAQAGRLVF